MYFSHNSGVIDYIISRIQERVKSMQKNRLLFINTISLEELKQNKSMMIKVFLEVEDDLKQSSQALSTLLTQNRDLVEEKENYDTIIRRYELRTFSLEKNIQEVNSKYEQLKQDNEILSRKLIENDRLLKENHERINSYETMIEEKQEYNGYLENEIYNLKLQIQEKENLIKNLQTIDKNTIKYNQEAERNEQKTIDSSQTHKLNNFSINDTNAFNHTFHNNEEERKEEPNEGFNYNVNNYLNERQNKKKLINDMIKEHLENNSREESNDLKPIKENNEEEAAYEEDDDSKKSRRDKLILKINNLEGCLQHLEENLGIDFLSKLLAQNISSQFLDKVEETVQNFEQPNQPRQSQSQTNEKNLNNNHNLRYGLNSNFKKSNPFLNNLNYNTTSNTKEVQILEDNNQNTSVKESRTLFGTQNGRNKKSILHKSSSSKNFQAQSQFKEVFSPDMSFENSLRNYKKTPTRVFKNYIKSGNYFDPKYQFGGQSIVGTYTKPHRSKTQSNNDSKDSIYKLTQNSNKY